MKHVSNSDSKRTDSPTNSEMYLPAMPRFLPAPGRVEKLLKNLLRRRGPLRLVLKNTE